MLEKICKIIMFNSSWMFKLTFLGNSYNYYMCMHLVGKQPKKLEENKMFTNQRAENTEVCGTQSAAPVLGEVNDGENKTSSRLQKQSSALIGYCQVGVVKSRNFSRIVQTSFAVKFYSLHWGCCSSQQLKVLWRILLVKQQPVWMEGSHSSAELEHEYSRCYFLFLSCYWFAKIQNSQKYWYNESTPTIPITILLCL